MSNHRTRRPYRKRVERRIRVKGERRDPPDTMRLSKALLAHAKELAAAQTEAEAQAEAVHAAERSWEHKEVGHETDS